MLIESLFSCFFLSFILFNFFILCCLFYVEALSDRNPCSFRGTILLHKQAKKLDPCTDCVCFNGTTTCNIESCPAELGCESSKVIIIPEECCPQCPYSKYHFIPWLHFFSDVILCFSSNKPFPIPKLVLPLESAFRYNIKIKKRRG